MSKRGLTRWLLWPTAALLIASHPVTARADGQVQLDLADYESLRGSPEAEAFPGPEFVRADAQVRPALQGAGDALWVDVEVRFSVRSYGPDQFIPLVSDAAVLLSLRTGAGGDVAVAREGDTLGMRVARAATHAFVLVVRSKATRDAGAWLAELPTPSAPITTLTIALPEAHVVWADENVVSGEHTDEEWVYRAAVGAAPAHSLRWRPAPQIDAARPRVLVNDSTLLLVRDGVVEGQTVLDVEAQGAPIEGLSLSWQGQLAHMDVVCDDVISESTTDNGLSVQFSRPVRTTQLTLRYEVPAPDGQFRAPQLRARGADRQTGHLAVEVRGGAEVAVQGDTDGVRPVDEDELPAGFPGVPGERRFAWRYFGEAYSVALSATQYERGEVLQVAVESVFATTVWTRQGRGLTTLRLGVLNNADQFLRLRLPAGAHLWSAHVDGRGVHPVTDEDQVMVPLRKSRRHGESLVPVTVELVLGHQGDGSGRFTGVVDTLLPSFDVVVGDLRWDLYLPEGNVWYGGDDWEDVEGLDGRWVAENLTFVPGRFSTVVIEETGEKRPVTAPQDRARHRGALPVKLVVPATGHRVAVRRRLLPAGARPALHLRYANTTTLEAVDAAVWLLAFLFGFSLWWSAWQWVRTRRFVLRSVWAGLAVSSGVCVVGMLAALPLAWSTCALAAALGLGIAAAVALARAAWNLVALARDVVVETFGDDDNHSEYTE